MSVSAVGLAAMDYQKYGDYSFLVMHLVNHAPVAYAISPLPSEWSRQTPDVGMRIGILSQSVEAAMELPHESSIGSLIECVCVASQPDLIHRGGRPRSGRYRRNRPER